MIKAKHNYFCPFDALHCETVEDAEKVLEIAKRRYSVAKLSEARKTIVKFRTSDSTSEIVEYFGKHDIDVQ